jgi:hypothetical protein
MHVSIEYSSKGAAVKPAKCREIFVSRSGSTPSPQLRKFFATTALGMTPFDGTQPGLPRQNGGVTSACCKQPARIPESTTFHDSVTDVVLVTPLSTSLQLRQVVAP